MKGFLKLFFEIGPLLVFFFLNASASELSFLGMTYKPIFLATAGFVCATLLSLAGMYLLMRKIPIMPLVSGVFVVVFGALTLFLHDETFIKMKPTIVNTIFGMILLGGLYYGRIFLKIIFDQAFELEYQGWVILTRRWSFFFFSLAVLNEIVWRCFTTDQWVFFKTWGVMPLTFLFVLLQLPVVLKYQLDEGKKSL